MRQIYIVLCVVPSTVDARWSSFSFSCSDLEKLPPDRKAHVISSVVVKPFLKPYYLKCLTKECCLTWFWGCTCHFHEAVVWHLMIITKQWMLCISTWRRQKEHLYFQDALHHLSDVSSFQVFMVELVEPWVCSTSSLIIFFIFKITVWTDCPSYIYICYLTADPCSVALPAISSVVFLSHSRV